MLNIQDQIFLSSGYSTHHILDQKILSKYLEAIADDMEDMVPNYKAVFTDVYQYYGNSLALFTNTIDDCSSDMGT